MKKIYALEMNSGSGDFSKEFIDDLDEVLYRAIGAYRRGKLMVRVRYISGNKIIWLNGKEVSPRRKK